MISIVRKLRPFTHQIGAQCVIPGTDCILKAFPHHVCVGDLEIPLQNDPFERPFTLQMDLDKNCVWVFGKKYRLKISAKENGFEIVNYALPPEKREQFFPGKIERKIPANVERLFLGSHKLLDWDRVIHSFDLKDVLPVLFDIGQKTPISSPLESSSLESLYHSTFQGLLAPMNPNAFGIYRQIRKLFFCEEEGQFHLLPKSKFPAGRLINVQTSMGLLDLQWVKMRPQKLRLRVQKSGEILFNSEARTFRYQKNPDFIHDASKPFFVEAGTTLFLDRFFV